MSERLLMSLLSAGSQITMALVLIVVNWEPRPAG